MLNRRLSVDVSELSRLYLDEDLTVRQIAPLIGTSARTVTRRLHAAGVPLRNPGYPAIAKLADREWLEREYGAGKSTTEIAAELGCSPRSVAHSLARHGIKARSTGAPKGHQRNTQEARRKMSASRRGRFLGADNPHWRGGITLKDPERNRYRAKMWVKAVKDRDGWRCVECGATERLHAHHIKRWRDYPSLRFEVSNGKTLCHDCHEAAHGRGFKFRWPTARTKAHERIGPVPTG